MARGIGGPGGEGVGTSFPPSGLRKKISRSLPREIAPCTKRFTEGEALSRFRRVFRACLHRRRPHGGVCGWMTGRFLFFLYVGV